MKFRILTTSGKFINLLHDVDSIINIVEDVVPSYDINSLQQVVIESKPDDDGANHRELAGYLQRHGFICSAGF